jgi:23S rRNA-/tRNA-specific pseudouridylate synthase
LSNRSIGITVGKHRFSVDAPSVILVTDIDRQRIEKTFHSKPWVFHVDPQEVNPETCGELLLRLLPHIDPATWGRRFELGGVYVAGREAAVDTLITSPCRLEYFEPLHPLEDVAAFYPPFVPEMVLYSDGDVGVGIKPPGLPTTAPRDQRLFTMQAYLGKAFGQPVHLPSRLDTAVSGLLLFSLSSRMNRYLQRAYDRRAVEKYYVAEVRGSFSDVTSDIRARIGRDSRHPVLRQVVDNGGDEAVTRVTKLGEYVRSGNTYSLVQAEPLTGRTHQIRVHLASLGFPIVGDPYYDGEEDPFLHLVSYALRFHHPYQQKVVALELPVASRPTWLENAREAIGGLVVKNVTE